ncbi:MAG: UDP-glucose dehydrogenase family protein [Elusimicrobiota bacterium]
MKKICVVGTGYVGLVSGTCFAEMGHHVICVDKDKNKIDILNSGHIPIYEPGLEELVKKNKKLGRLKFTTSIEEGVTPSEIVFIAVNTPSMEDGSADLSFVEASTREVVRFSKGYKLLVEKSTVPVQTGDRIKSSLSAIRNSKATIEVASNPEFLREGSAIKDFLNPDRIVIGVESKRSEKILRELYQKLKAPMIVTDIKSAELIKHASNSFLALKISYINAIANICEKVGADVGRVSQGMGFDKRIGASFLNAGIGYGGSCFPKDIAAFIKIADQNGYDFSLLKAVQKINSDQRLQIVKKIEEKLWNVKDKNIGILGLSFKPDTDDLRNAPALDIIQALLSKGAKIKAFDPIVNNKVKKIIPQVEYMDDIYSVAKHAHALVILTEWNVFRKMNLKKVRSVMESPVIIDGRNIFSLEQMEKNGFSYVSVGRPAVV